MALSPEQVEARLRDGLRIADEDVLALCAEVRRLDAALESAEAALRKERESVEVVSFVTMASHHMHRLRVTAVITGTTRGGFAIVCDDCDAETICEALAAEQETT